MHIPPPLRGVTLPEALVSIAILAVIGVAIIPNYRTYKIRSDLSFAVEQAEHMLGRAQILSQLGGQASGWGYQAEAGTVFLGNNYETRDTIFDEVISVPSGIAVSGITEVHFTPLYGEPSVSGEIVFTAQNGDQRFVTIGSGILAGPPIPPVQFRVSFDRIKNSGNGAVENKVYVGENAVLYEENEWIPLTDNTVPIVDSDIVLAVNGLSVQRENGFVRIVAYGGLESGGKEVVDATIHFKRGFIDSIANEEGEHEGEQPFDGNTNEGVGGDEYTLAEGRMSAEFKTRVTNAGDTILLYWNGGMP